MVEEGDPKEAFPSHLVYLALANLNAQIDHWKGLMDARSMLQVNSSLTNCSRASAQSGLFMALSPGSGSSQPSEILDTTRYTRGNH